jgi:PIN domain nuclease of toxin-antitoxin system
MPIVKNIQQYTVLLDTHVFLWYMLDNSNSKLTSHFIKSLEQKEKNGEKVLLSVISIWEIGMLVEKGRLVLEMDTSEWVEKSLQNPITELAALTPEIALLSSRLPGIIHGDPADRMLIATAHKYNALLVTCDEKIIEYGHDRFINVYNPVKYAAV